MGACISNKACACGGGNRRRSSANSNVPSGITGEPLENSNSTNNNDNNNQAENTNSSETGSLNNLAMSMINNSISYYSTNSTPQPILIGSTMTNPSYYNSSNHGSGSSPFVPPTGRNRRLKKDFIKNFKFDKKITEAQLNAKREEFWDTAPAFEGKIEIWTALKAAVEAYEQKNYQLAQAIIDSANIILPKGFLNDCYDELGNRYQIPIYVLAKPTNMRRSVADVQADRALAGAADGSNVENDDSSLSPVNNKKSVKRPKKSFQFDVPEDEDDDEDEIDDFNLNSLNIQKTKSNFFKNKLRFSKVKNNASNLIGSTSFSFEPSKKSSKPGKEDTDGTFGNNTGNNGTSQPVGSNLQRSNSIEDLFQIRVRLSHLAYNENELKLRVTASQTTRQLKQQIADATDVEPSRLRLFFGVTPQPSQTVANVSATNNNSASLAVAGTKPANPSASYHNVQNYIKELEISEGQLSSCLKNVYENGQKEEFMKRLEERIKAYDVEIEQLCNANYKSFVETFAELLLVREDTAVLKSNLVENNIRIQKIGKNLITKVNELTQETKKQNNILVSIEALNKYMPVFHIYRQLKEQMARCNYYPALKLLEELENNYLPIVKHYRFSKSIHQSIPLFKEEIKAHTITELKTFLENVRILSEQVGRIANQQVANKLKIDKKFYIMERDLSNEEITSANNLKKLPFDVVDFSPLYKNLHMNQVIGSKAFFADYYRSQRRKQLQLHLQFNDTLMANSESLDSYKKYFHTVTGFFVIEDQVLSSTEGLVDERYMDELFSMAVPRLINVILKVMEQSRDAEVMLKIKILVVLFCNTIEEVQFPTVQLSDVLKEIKDKYYQVLLNKCDSKIQQILSEDNYSCIECATEADYKLQRQQFPCPVDVSLSDQPSAQGNFGPHRLPYSACVPKIFNEIKEFVNNCKKFADGLNSSQTELDDMIRKPTNRLITDKINEDIRVLIKKVSLAQLVQIVVNTCYLEKSITLLEEHLLTVIEASSSKQSGKLQGISVFRDLRSEAEAQIYELLNVKIDELLDLENFDWNKNQIQGQASEYMKSLLSFLKGTLETFNHLPSKLAQTACISGCKHVAQSLMNHMTNPELKAITFGSIEQLDLDLLQCQTFASQIQIKGLSNETISLCFDDIRQLLDLLLTKEWSVYLKDYGKPNNKYNRVQANTALNMLEKLKEGSRKGKGIFARLDIGSKDSDMKLMELASKQLKTLITNNASF